MTILYPALQFLQGQPIVAPQRRRGLVQSEFYLQDQQSPQLPQQATSEQYILEQLQKIKNRAAPPKLEPAARIRNIDSSMADPSNFQGFYQRLQSIDQMGKEQLSAARAQATLARLRSSQQLSSGVGESVSPLPASRNSSYGRVGSAVSGSAVPSNPRENFKYAQQLAGQFGWGGSNELGAWYTLGMKESGWRNNAQNPTSTAYGIGQFLNSTWAGVGIGKTSDPYTQVLAMARYIKNRYGSPSRALSFHRSHNWY